MSPVSHPGWVVRGAAPAEDSGVMKTTLRNRVLATLAALAVAAIAAPTALGDQTTPRANGEGVDAYGLEFDFHAHNALNPHGHAFFETNSFGDGEGEVDCLAVQGRRLAALSGELGTPLAGGLTHFMVIANDRRARRGDRVTTWLRNGPFDCATDGFGDLSDSLRKIRRGAVKVVPPAASAKAARAAAPASPSSDQRTVSAGA